MSKYKKAVRWSIVVVLGFGFFFLMDMTQSFLEPLFHNIFNMSVEISGFALAIASVVVAFVGFVIGMWSKSDPTGKCEPLPSSNLEEQYDKILNPIKHIVDKVVLDKFKKEAIEKYIGFAPVLVVKFGSHQRTNPMPRDVDISLFVVGEGVVSDEPDIIGTPPKRNKKLCDLVCYDFAIAVNHLCIGSPLAHSMISQASLISGSKHFLDILRNVATSVLVSQDTISSYLQSRLEYHTSRFSALEERVSPSVAAIYAYWIITTALQKRLVFANKAAYWTHPDILKLADLGILRKNVDSKKARRHFDKIVQRFKGEKSIESHAEIAQYVSEFVKEEGLL